MLRTSTKVRVDATCIFLTSERDKKNLAQKNLAKRHVHAVRTGRHGAGVKLHVKESADMDYELGCANLVSEQAATLVSISHTVRILTLSWSTIAVGAGLVSKVIQSN